MQLLDKDVLKRLDITAAMQHPWVTHYGTMPLVSCREQAMRGSVSVSQEEIDAAVRQIDGNMVDLMDVVFEEVHYMDRCGVRRDVL